jgi:nanoRNase/pAp phosphatase (c-di-AMP/oligoRNAs hydrolase)
MDSFQDYIKNEKSILTIASRPLDFDSLGSGLILKKYLESLGKKVTLMQSSILSADEKDLYSFLPFFNEVKFSDTREALSGKKFDVLILLDGTNLVQYYNENSLLEKPNLKSYDKIIHIDHHQALPEKLGTWTLQKKVSSSAEVILTEIIPEDFIDKDIANLGYSAIVGDTGNFKWSFQPDTLKLAGKLLDKGANYMEIINKYSFSKSQLYMEMMAYGIKNCEYNDGLHTQFLFIPYEKLQKDGIDKHKLAVLKEAFQEEVARVVKGFARGFMVYEERPGKIIISARGNNLTNKINMPEMLKEIGGNGGGHLNACRAEVSGDFEEIKIRLIDLILKHLQTT